jgi:hypothetical protein
MADSKRLTKFSVEPDGTGFIFHIEDDTGRSFDLSATRDQVDVIADTLDDLLSADDSGDEVTDDEDFDEDDLDEDYDDEEDDESEDAEPPGHDPIRPPKR